jgi:hypothetical protein
LAKVDLSIIFGKDVVKAALWKAHVKGHLATFKTVDRHTATAGLTFLTTATGFTNARAKTTADTNAGLTRPIVITDFIQFHNALAFAFLALKNKVKRD